MGAEDREASVFRKLSVEDNIRAVLEMSNLSKSFLIKKMIDDVVAGAVKAVGQPALGHGHAHATGEALPQRAGRHLHAGRQTVLRVPGRQAAPLPESLQLSNLVICAAT